MVKVKVPATTANLGAGFDSMGIAVSLYNYIYMDFSDELLIVSLDKVKVPTGKTNLIYKSACLLFDICGFKDFKGLNIQQENNILHTKGLGSSSACIVGGLMGANALLGFPLKKQEILNIATKLEGHPDNVASAVFGGMVVCAVKNDNVYFVKHKVSDKLDFIFFIPDFKMATSKAREVLSDVVPLKDAVFNISRSNLFLSSIIEEKFSNIKIGVEDMIHQEKRLDLIENGRTIFELAYKLGAYGVYLSGAGPTIVAICDKNENFEEKADLKLKEMDIKGWKVFNFKLDFDGVVAESFGKDIK